MTQLLFVLVVFVFVVVKISMEAAKNAVGFRKPHRVRAEDHEIAEYLKQIAYYQQLNNGDKHIFLERVQYFLANKDFQGMQGQVMNNEVRSIVAASAVQISFRLSEWTFPSFHTFRIYPESFYSQIFRKYLKGGAGQTGQIWFSLQDYREGYENPTNGINLGLHEMAHAIIIEMQNGKLDHAFTHAYERIEELAKDRMPKIRNREISFIREYGGTNQMEFIAVCTEIFFERPDEFRSLDRELYDAFMWLYKQEPHTPPSILQITNLPPAEKPKRNYRFAKWHWSLTLVLCGIFLAPVFLTFLMQDVALSFEYSWLLALAVLIASSFFLYKPIVKSGALHPTQFYLCHIFGLWPLILAALLLINNFIPVWEEGEVRKVRSIYWETKTKAIVSYVGGAPNGDEGYSVVNVEENGTLRAGDFVVVVTQFGPLGIPVHGRNRPIHIPENVAEMFQR